MGQHAAARFHGTEGDLLIRELWYNGTDSVHDISVMNTDAKSHSEKLPENYLLEAERENMRIYLEECLQQRSHFSPFFASADGFLGVEVTATLKRIASCLVIKWRQP